MARASVSQKQLLKIEGVEEVQKEIARRLALLRHRGQAGQVGDALKHVYHDAAEPLVNEVKTGIASLSVERSAKNVLTGQVVRGRGPRRFPNAFVAMYQWAVNVKARATAGGRVPNPYWFEYGTVDRKTKSGKSTGRMKPTPFFRPAITRSREAVKKRLVDGLRRVLVKGDE